MAQQHKYAVATVATDGKLDWVHGRMLTYEDAVYLRRRSGQHAEIFIYPPSEKAIALAVRRIHGVGLRGARGVKMSQATVKPGKVSVDARALRKVVDYLWLDERGHYLECEDDRRNHIFTSVASLWASLEGDENPQAILRKIRRVG